MAIRPIRPATLLPTYVGAVCTRCRLSQNIATGTLAFCKRTYHYAREDITWMRIGYSAWYSNLNSGEVATGASTVAASFEYPFSTSTAGTICKVITWNGATTTTAASGITTWSDWTHFPVPKGAKFGSRMWVSTTVSNPYNDYGTYVGAWKDTANGDVLDFSGTNLVSGGSMTDSGDQTCFTPMIIGLTRRPSIAILGDSRQSGWADTVDPNVGDAGDVARTYGKTLAYLNLAVGGDTAASFVNGAHSAQRRLLAQYCTHWTSDMAVNDLTAGTSVATTEANIQFMLGMPGLASKPAIWELMYGESTSTNSWATTGAQTTNANNGNINTLNAWTQAGVLSMNGISDPRAAVMNPPITGGIWLAPGPYTADGVHPTQLGYQDIMNGGGVNPLFITRRS